MSAGGVDWQPIETCPKEPGEPILIWVPDGPSVVSWEIDGWTEPCFVSWLEGSNYQLPHRWTAPTYWARIGQPESS